MKCGRALNSISNPLLLLRRREGGADGRRVGILPLERERSALRWLDRVDGAEVVFRQVGARAVGTALEHERLAVGRELRLMGDEVGFRHAEMRGDGGDLRIRHTDDAVIDPAASAAATAMELFHMDHAFSLSTQRSQRV